MATSVIKKMDALKKIILANVFYLINKLGLKIGDVEERAGVSTGYLSRLNKDDNSTKLGLDLVSSLSTVLGLPMDLLCHVDLTGLTPNEAKAVMFIGKLMTETISNDRNWIRVTRKDMAELETYKDGSTANPLVRGDGVHLWYDSKFAEVQGTEVAGDVYHSEIGNDNFIYIAPVHYPDSTETNYELYLCHSVQEEYESWWNLYPVCASDPKEDSEVGSSLKKLYAAINETNRRIQFDDYVKNTIDAFLNPPAPQPDPSAGFSAVEADELPF